MEVAFALLCDREDIGADGKLNVLGAFDRLTALEFPIEMPMMHLAIGLRADAAEIGESRKIVVRFYNQQDKDIGQMIVQAVVPGSPNSCSNVRFHTILELANAAIPEPGEYEFRIFVEDAQATIPLSVTRDGSESEV